MTSVSEISTARSQANTPVVRPNLPRHVTLTENIDKGVLAVAQNPAQYNGAISLIDVPPSVHAELNNAYRDFYDEEILKPKPLPNIEPVAATREEALRHICKLDVSNETKTFFVQLAEQMMASLYSAHPRSVPFQEFRPTMALSYSWSRGTEWHVDGPRDVLFATVVGAGTECVDNESFAGTELNATLRRKTIAVDPHANIYQVNSPHIFFIRAGFCAEEMPIERRGLIHRGPSSLGMAVRVNLVFYAEREDI